VTQAHFISALKPFFFFFHFESITKFPAPKLETLTATEMEDYQKLCQKYNVNPAGNIN